MLCGVPNQWQIMRRKILKAYSQMDVRMPKRSGPEVLEALRHVGNLPSAILLTTFYDDEALLHGIRAGARGFLLKDVSLDQLAEAIRQVAAGETLISPAVTVRVVRAAGALGRQIEGLDPPDQLTRRETEVLHMMAGGYSNREIGEALGTTEGTIKSHISSILSKMGARPDSRRPQGHRTRRYLIGRQEVQPPGYRDEKTNKVRICAGNQCPPICLGATLD